MVGPVDHYGDGQCYNEDSQESTQTPNGLKEVQTSNYCGKRGLLFPQNYMKVGASLDFSNSDNSSKKNKTLI